MKIKLIKRKVDTNSISDDQLIKEAENDGDKVVKIIRIKSQEDAIKVLAYVNSLGNLLTF